MSNETWNKKFKLNVLKLDYLLNFWPAMSLEKCQEALLVLAYYSNSWTFQNTFQTCYFSSQKKNRLECLKRRYAYVWFSFPWIIFKQELATSSRTVLQGIVSLKSSCYLHIVCRGDLEQNKSRYTAVGSWCQKVTPARCFYSGCINSCRDRWLIIILISHCLLLRGNK